MVFIHICPRCSYLLYCSDDDSIYGHCLSVMVLLDLLAMLLCLFSLGRIRTYSCSEVEIVFSLMPLVTLKRQACLKQYRPTVQER